MIEYYWYRNTEQRPSPVTVDGRWGRSYFIAAKGSKAIAFARVLSQDIETVSVEWFEVFASSPSTDALPTEIPRDQINEVYDNGSRNRD